MRFERGYARPMSRLLRASCCVFLLVGCASATANQPALAVVPPASIEIVPVSFQLWERVTIHNDGEVRLGVGLFGNLSADGRLVRSDGTLIATLAEDGMVRIGDSGAPAFRITQEGIHQALPITNGTEGPPAYYIDENTLVIGATNQTLPIEGFRRGAESETLFVASVIVGTREDVWNH